MGRAVQRDQRLAGILLVGAWTGLRWSELRAVRVRDFVEVPLPVLVVQRVEPDRGHTWRGESEYTSQIREWLSVSHLVRDGSGRWS